MPKRPDSLETLQLTLELLKRIRVERRKKWEEAELAKMVAKGKAPRDDKWKAKYAGMEVSDLRRMRGLEDENRRLKQIVANQALDLDALKALTSKNYLSPKSNDRPS